MTQTNQAPQPTVRKLGNTSAQQPSQLRKSNGMLIVNMGTSGSGKTTLLETLLPKYGPICILDVDGKAHVLRDNPIVDIYPARTWDTLDTKVQDIEKQSLSPYYKTLCVDGTTALQMASWRKTGADTEPNPQLRQTAYGKSNVLMVDLAQRCRTLSERGMNVIFNIWSMREKEEGDSMVRIFPDITPTLLTRMLGLFDFVFYTEPNAPPKPYPPLLRTGGSLVYATRSALSPESPLHDMPDTIYNPSYTSILDSFHGEPWPTEKHKKQ